MGFAKGFDIIGSGRMGFASALTVLDAEGGRKFSAASCSPPPDITCIF